MSPGSGHAALVLIPCKSRDMQMSLNHTLLNPPLLTAAKIASTKEDNLFQVAICVLGNQRL
eukprot:1148258-Pelagomonas_calceolata.AAC.1